MILKEDFLRKKQKQNLFWYNFQFDEWKIEAKLRNNWNLKGILF